MKSRADLAAYIAADDERQGIQWRATMRVTNRVAYFKRLLRHLEYWWPVNGRYAYLLHIRATRLGETLGLSIPPFVFGPGLSIAHPGTIVVNPEARVGANCRIHQGVTIGEINGAYPVIGDDVHIAPNVLILGGVTIGDRVSVAPGTIVRDDIPTGATVAGNPAHVAKVTPNRVPWWA